jgi:putative methionine-R-sulfoxide reductase with GAF domain
MSWDTIGRGIDAVLQSNAGRFEKAVRTAELIRQAGGYRWVGLYEVKDREIVVLGWSGPGAPGHPRFPATRGLSGVAVVAKRTVLVNDVTTDPRYLTTSAGTLAEIIVPLVDPAGSAVVGTLDVEVPNATPSPRLTAKRWSGAPPPSPACLHSGWFGQRCRGRRDG